MVFINIADLTRLLLLTAFPTAGMTAAGNSFARRWCCARRYILLLPKAGTGRPHEADHSNVRRGGRLAEATPGLRPAKSDCAVAVAISTISRHSRS